ncbi:MAG: TolC family protein [Balneolaceae bacterium]
MQEAIDTALENSYQLQQTRNNVSLAEAEIFSAKADFLPSVNGSFSGTRRIGQQFDQTTVRFEDITTNTINGSINANITVFNGFTNILNLRRSNANHSFQKENEERLRETVIFNTASSFLQVVLNQELLTIALETLEASRSQLEQIRAQVEVGARPTVDLFNQESVVANDELSVIQRENALEFSKTQLSRNMQLERDVEIELDVPDTDDLLLMPTDLSLSEMIDLALNNRSDLIAQQFLIERNENDERITRAALYPVVTASGGFNTVYNDQFRGIVVDPDDPGNIMRVPVSFPDQFFDQNVNRFIGFNVQIPFFNNWNRRINLQSSQIAVKNSRLELDNIRFQILEDVRQAYNDYVSFSKELESTAKSLAAAERAFETEQQRYNVGASTLIELNQANANFVQAQSNRVQAIYNFIFQEKLLDYFLGQLNSRITLN